MQNKRGEVNLIINSNTKTFNYKNLGLYCFQDQISVSDGRRIKRNKKHQNAKDKIFPDTKSKGLLYMGGRNSYYGP